MEHKFTRGPADDGIHDYETLRQNIRRLSKAIFYVTVGQLVLGTLFAVALMALYVGFAWLEG
jgi:hypothetical protein